MNPGIVGVVGAGVCGITAARALTRKGLRVRVLEQSRAIGGKVTTSWLDGRSYELGALGLSSAARSALSAEGRRPIPCPMASVRSESGETSILSWWLQSDPEASRAKLLTALTYRMLMADARCWRKVTPSFANLHTTTHTNAFAKAIDIVYRGLGYGSIADSPHYAQTLYDGRTTRAYLYGALGLARHGYSSLEGGLQGHMESRAEGLDIQLGAAVTAIRRREGQVQVDVRTPDGSYTQVYDRVLLTGPASSMLGYLDCSAEEAEVLGAVSYAPCRSTLLRVSGYEGRTFMWFRPHPSEGRLALLVKLYPDADVCVAYQSYRSTATSLQASEKALCEDVRTLGGEVLEVVEQRWWPYYHPHFSPDQVEAGMRQKAMSVQGSGGVYYAGAWLSFESVLSMVNLANELVEEHF